MSGYVVVKEVDKFALLILIASVTSISYMLISLVIEDFAWWKVISLGINLLITISSYRNLTQERLVSIKIKEESR